MLVAVNYHYIRKSYDHEFSGIHGVTPEIFSEHVRLMLKTGDIISQQDLLSDSNTAFRDENLYWLITFDDGLKEQYEYALPVLNEFKLPALFFVNTQPLVEQNVLLVHMIHLLRAHVGSENLMDFLYAESGVVRHAVEENRRANIKYSNFYKYDSFVDAELKYLLNYMLDASLVADLMQKAFAIYMPKNEKEYSQDLYMSERQVQVLSEKGMLGCHTHTHRLLGNLDTQQLKQEIEISSRILNKITETNIFSISYPYGGEKAYNDAIINLCRQNKFHLGFTVGRQINNANTDLMKIARYSPNDVFCNSNDDLGLDLNLTFALPRVQSSY